MKHDDRQKQGGFTLIELLVVISIIVLLIAILLPVLGKARETAKATLCASGHRQIGIAFMAYAADNKSYIPPRSSSPAYWSLSYGTMVSVGWRTILEYHMSSVTPSISKNSPNKIFICPSFIPPNAPPYSNSIINYPYSLGYTGIAMNAMFAKTETGHRLQWVGYEWPYPAVADSTYYPVPLNAIRRPSEVIFTGDTTDEPYPTSNPYYGTFIGPTKTPQGFNYYNEAITGNRHLGTANRLFGDGHVGRYNPPKLEKNYKWYYPGTLP